MEAVPDDRPTVAIAGATGFVGTSIRAALAEDYRIIGLTRSPVRARMNAGRNEREEWRHCDLFSSYAVRDALEGADYAIYLVHSMLPSARLTQAEFVDLDLLLADNFARAAEAQGIKQILYVGGLIPEERPLPPRLASRLEVEKTLGSSAVPLTALRAGLIVGPGGTRLSMLLNLVQRLPVMVLPAWTEAMTQPIAIDDVARALKHALGRPDTYSGHFDVGGPEAMTYRSMLLRTARTLGLKRHVVTTPISAPALSKLWVRVFGGVPWALVDPVIESLNHNATVQDNALQRWLSTDVVSFEDALQKSVTERGRQYPNPREALRDEDDNVIRADSVARSVQRLPLPPQFTARDVAQEYMRWLPEFGWPFLRCDVEGDHVQFRVRSLPRPLLELEFAQDRSPEGRQLFYVTGGLLADMTGHHEGRLEFRRALNGECVIAAVHDFAPRLPWYVYNATQAIGHLWVMNSFSRHLARLAAAQRREEEASASTRPVLH
jgi:uncharacterized protein YbjT (DUF2867 family)